ncbi:MAG: hypothetical protein AAGC56_15225, partial [Pseudomonadota bacterium]
MMRFIASNEKKARAKARRAFGDKTHVHAVRDLPSGDVEVTASDRPNANGAARADLDRPMPTPSRTNGRAGDRAPASYVPAPRVPAPHLNGAANGEPAPGAPQHAPPGAFAGGPPPQAAGARRDPSFAADRSGADRSAAHQAARSGADATAHAAGARLNEAIENRYASHALERVRDNLSTRAAPAGARDIADPDVRALNDILAPHRLSDGLFGALVEGARNAAINDPYAKLESGFAAAFPFAPLG